jgi:hypothetical protein
MKPSGTAGRPNACSLQKDVMGYKKGRIRDMTSTRSGSGSKAKAKLTTTDAKLTTATESTAATQLVLKALSDPRYDFRTIDGIAKTSKLCTEEVNGAIKNLGDKVRVANVTDAHGNLLYTLSSRPKKIREIVSETRAFLAGSAR